MRGNFAQAFAIGLVAVAVAVGAILFMQRGAHVELTGQIKVRTVASSPNEALVLVDLHITNPSDYAFETHNVTVVLETKSGEFPQAIASRADAKRLFDSMPDAGPFHPTLYTDSPIPAHSTADYTIAASYNAPERILKGRTRFVVQIQEINGKMVEFAESAAH